MRLPKPINEPPKGALYYIFNCRVLRGQRIVPGELWFRDGVVVSSQEIKEADYLLDARNAIISAGFIDLQLNGAFGVDFLLEKDKKAGLLHCRKQLLKTGVTAFCPTLITANPKDYHEAIPYYKKIDGDGVDGAACLGPHCEGPFINKKRKGAHPEEWVTDFDNGFIDVLSVYGGPENVSQMSICTLAPEKENSREVIEKLTQSGVCVSIGHTMANLNDCKQAVAAGARKITHLFNAMPAFHHRDPSVPGLLTRSEIELYYGIISDHVHTHPTAIRLADRMREDGMCLVTDGISALGRGEGDYPLGEVTVEVTRPSEDLPARAIVKGTKTLGGAIAPMDECVRYAATFLDSKEKALYAATMAPAKCLRLEDKKGHLEVGASADFIVLDDNLVITETWVNGIKGFQLNSEHGLKCVNK